MQLPDTSTLWGSRTVCALLGASIAAPGQAPGALPEFGEAPPAVKPATQASPQEPEDQLI